MTCPGAGPRGAAEVMTIVALATPVDQREAAFVRLRAQGDLTPGRLGLAMLTCEMHGI